MSLFIEKDKILDDYADFLSKYNPIKDNDGLTININ
jgi:hypothetical protein